MSVNFQLQLTEVFLMKDVFFIDIHSI